MTQPNRLTRRSALKLGLAAGATLTFPAPALAQLRIIVEGANFRPVPIAIPDFTGSDPVFAREVAEIVRANLRRSGLFVPLDPVAMPALFDQIDATPDFAAWRAAGADALVTGAAERGTVITSQVRVWDTQGA